GPIQRMSVPAIKVSEHGHETGFSAARCRMVWGKGTARRTTRSVRAPFEFRGQRLDEFQIQAIIALQQETATLVSAPTGTGKSLIADYLVDESLKSGRRVVYTAPIKALVNQKYREIGRAHV